MVNDVRIDEKNEHSLDFQLLPPKVDVVFKLLFGDYRNKEILVDFLKSVLNLADEEYTVIAIEDPQLKRENLDDKLSIVDVRLSTKTGKILHIEVQVYEQDELPERVTYCNSKLLVTQLKKGQGYDSLRKTISIVIADFDLVPGSPNYHHVFQYRDEMTGIRFTDITEICTLELHKTPPKNDHTQKYLWAKFLNSKRKEEFQMIAEKNPVIEKAYAELKRLSQDEEARLLYEIREREIRDEKARMRTAHKRGEVQGDQRRQMQVAKNFLKMGLSVEQVAQGTELSIEEVRKLKAEI